MFFFLELSCFLYDPAYFGNLISGSFAFSKSSLYIWNFSVHILLKSRILSIIMWNVKLSMWNECHCVAVWTFFGISLLWDWNENRPLPVLWPLLSFPNLADFSSTKTEEERKVFLDSSSRHNLAQLIDIFFPSSLFFSFEYSYLLFAVKSIIFLPHVIGTPCLTPSLCMPHPPNQLLIKAS